MYAASERNSKNDIHRVSYIPYKDRLHVLGRKLSRQYGGAPVMPSHSSSSWARIGFALFAIGWGANHFTPLLPVYRAELHLSDTVVKAMFAAYVLGLIPMLIAAAKIGQKLGHRTMLRFALIGSMIASSILALSQENSLLLFVGRVLYGVCMGAAMAPATTWIKELSTGSPIGTGARRAAMSMSAGFAAGPLISGTFAQWLPAARVLPYVVHLAVMAGACVVAWSVPLVHARSGIDAARSGRGPEILPRHPLRRAIFWYRVAPMAPWVFACSSIALVVLPNTMHENTASWITAFSGLIAGVTLGVGVCVQGPARRIEMRRLGAVAALGCLAASLGLVLAAILSGHASPAFAIGNSVVLGAGYGLLLVAGLTQVERISTPDSLAMTNAVFYALTYTGFFVPTLIAALSSRWSELSILIGLAVVCTLTAGVAATMSASFGTETRSQPSSAHNTNGRPANVPERLESTAPATTLAVPAEKNSQDAQ